MKLRKTHMIMVATALFCMVQPALSAPIISVEPSQLNVLQGDVFTVNITIDPAGDEIMGAQYDLYFDNVLLNATDQVSGTFLSQDGASTTVYKNDINNTLGRLEYSQARIGVLYGATGYGILSTVTFKALEPGTCTLDLSDVRLSDPNAQYITDLVINDGSVTINETHFIISGWINYDNGNPVQEPGLTVTNLNTGDVFIAEIDANHYQISTDFAHAGSGDILHFDANDNLGNTTEFDHPVTQSEMNAGGFIQNITIHIPDTTPPVITNITAAQITKDSAIISWDTDELSDSLIQYGIESGNYNQTIYSSENTMFHSFNLTGLLMDTTYYYIVNSTDPGSNSAWSTEHSFRTFPQISISIDDVSVMPGETVTTSIIISDIINVGTADIALIYNESIVHVTAVDSSDFDFMDSSIDNSSGTTRIAAFQTTPDGLNGDVRIANITLTAVGDGGQSCVLGIGIIELKEASADEITIPASVQNGSFTIRETSPPLLLYPVAYPLFIPEDTDLDPGWGEISRLNITVIDDCSIASVTIDLSSIGGMPDRIMTRIEGTDIWTVTTNASIGTAVVYNETYLAHNLGICAEDMFGNINTSISIPLTVVQNGDVSENGNLTMFDAMYMVKHLLGKHDFEMMHEAIGEVSGNGIVSTYDAMYLAQHVIGESEYAPLH